MVTGSQYEVLVTIDCPDIAVVLAAQHETVEESTPRSTGTAPGRITAVHARLVSLPPGPPSGTAPGRITAVHARLVSLPPGPPVLRRITAVHARSVSVWL